MAQQAGGKGSNGSKGLPTDDEAEDRDPEKVEIRHVADDEDLVIDGETVIDDLLVAQRIAEQEAMISAHIFDDEGTAPAIPRKKAPTSADLQKLLRLLRETSKLTSKIGELPGQFDSVIGEDVKAACRMAADVMTNLPLPEGDEDAEMEDPVGEEAWSAGCEDTAAALAAVDLQSTDSEAEEGKPCQPSAVVGQVEASGVAEEEEDEEEEEEAQEAPPAAPQGGCEKTERQQEVANVPVPAHSRSKDPEEGAPFVKIKDMPKRIADTDEKECIGHIQSVVDGMVVVQGEEDGKVVDLQSVLCVEDGRVLGAIVDVFGPITLPHYLVVASSSVEEFATLGASVFAATGLEETSFLADGMDGPNGLAALKQQLGLQNESDEDDESEDEENGPSEDEGSKAGAWGPAGAATLECAARGVWAPEFPQAVKEEEAKVKVEDNENRGGRFGRAKTPSMQEDGWPETSPPGQQASSSSSRGSSQAAAAAGKQQQQFGHEQRNRVQLKGNTDSWGSGGTSDSRWEDRSERYSAWHGNSKNRTGDDGHESAPHKAAQASRLPKPPPAPLPTPPLPPPAPLHVPPPPPGSDSNWEKSSPQAHRNESSRSSIQPPPSSNQGSWHNSRQSRPGNETSRRSLPLPSPSGKDDRSWSQKQHRRRREEEEEEVEEEEEEEREEEEEDDQENDASWGKLPLPPKPPRNDDSWGSERGGSGRSKSVKDDSYGRGGWREEKTTTALPPPPPPPPADCSDHRNDQQASRNERWQDEYSRPSSKRPRTTYDSSSSRR